MNALVTAIGSFSADIVIKGLKKKGFRVIGCDIYPKEWIVDANFVNEFYQVPLTTKTRRYLEVVQEICIKEKIKYILPLTDVEVDVFNQNRKWFIDNNVCLCISPKEALEICRNKKLIEEFIRKNSDININTIPTSMFNDVEKSPYEYPIVCKPYNGRSSQGVQYIYNDDEWNLLKKYSSNRNYIIQPYIGGKIVTVDVVRNPETEKVTVLARKELLRTLNGAGTSVYVYRDDMLEKNCKDLARTLGICGCVNFEFILDKNDIYHFIECNPRFSGGVEFSCIAGYDYIGNHMNCFCGEDIDEFGLIHNHYISRKYEEYITKVE